MNNWAVRLFSKSVVKQIKYKHLERFIGDTKGKRCLDLGSDNGVISYLLRQKGGKWSSADIADAAIESMQTILSDEVYRVDEKEMPFNNSEFDLVAIVDLLEHINADKDFLSEIDRVLKKNSTLIINVPHKKKVSLIRCMRSVLGLTDEQHGHVREGYTFQEIKSMLPDHYVIEKRTTYSKLFLEIIDMVISFIFHMLSKGRQSQKGTLVTEKDMKKYNTLFKLYSITYPFLYCVALLDNALFFMSGYRLIISCRKGR